MAQGACKAVIVIDYRIDEQGNGEAELNITASPGCDLDDPPMALRIARYMCHHVQEHMAEAVRKNAN